MTTAQPTPRTRADVNRANATHSTGPKSSEGRARASQNSGDEPASLSEAKTPWAHGLYSQQLVTQDEDPAEFDELRATLRREHQPANTTEEILVDELAQSFWRLRRFRALEARAWDPDKLNSWIDTGLMALVHRNANSAERSFHKTLATLAKLQKERGFVPQKAAEEQSAVVEKQPGLEESGFVPEKPAAGAGFVPEKTAAEIEAFEYFGHFPEDAEKFVESLLDERDYLPGVAETAA